MATEEEPNKKVEKLSEVKIEKVEKKPTEDEKEKPVDLVSVVSESFGLAVFDVKDMILGGTVTIDGKEWRPEEGRFDIYPSEIDGKEIEVTSFPKSIKFTYDKNSLNEYRTSPS